jgi:hypothetical protein
VRLAQLPPRDRRSVPHIPDDATQDRASAARYFRLDREPATALIGLLDGVKVVETGV